MSRLIDMELLGEITGDQDFWEPLATDRFGNLADAAVAAADEEEARRHIETYRQESRELHESRGFDIADLQEWSHTYGVQTLIQHLERSPFLDMPAIAALIATGMQQGLVIGAEAERRRHA